MKTTSIAALTALVLPVVAEAGYMDTLRKSYGLTDERPTQLHSQMLADGYRLFGPADDIMGGLSRDKFLYVQEEGKYVWVATVPEFEGVVLKDKYYFDCRNFTFTDMLKTETTKNFLGMSKKSNPVYDLSERSPGGEMRRLHQLMCD